jgi:hypothetical protein
MSRPARWGMRSPGSATFHDNVLSSIAWQALREGLFTGCCPIVLEPETDDAEQIIVVGELLFVTFGDAASMCNGHAGVMGCWEELLDGCWMRPPGGAPRRPGDALVPGAL